MRTDIGFYAAVVFNVTGWALLDLPAVAAIVAFVAATITAVNWSRNG